MLSLLVPLAVDLPTTDVVRLAQHAEALGYGGIWYADERFERDTYAVLAAIAIQTQTLMVGPAVADPYTRHPAITSASIATLNEISAGRARLGIGVGISGFDNLGIVPLHPAAAVTEAVAIVRGLLSGEKVTLQGRVRSLRSGQLRFKSRNGVPIWIAAGGPVMRQTAARHGDGVIIAHTADPATVQNLVGMLRTEQNPQRTPLGVCLRLDVSVARDRREAVWVAKVRLGRLLWSQYPNIEYLQRHRLQLPEVLDARLRAAGPFRRTHNLDEFVQFADAIPDDFVAPIVPAGSADDVSRVFRALLAAGVTEFMVHPLVPSSETLESVLAGISTAFVAARGASSPASHRRTASPA